MHQENAFMLVSYQRCHRRSWKVAQNPTKQLIGMLRILLSINDHINNFQTRFSRPLVIAITSSNATILLDRHCGGQQTSICSIVCVAMARALPERGQRSPLSIWTCLTLPPWRHGQRVRPNLGLSPFDLCQEPSQTKLTQIEF